MKPLRDFELHIATEPGKGVAKFRLIDRHGTHVAASQVKLVDHPPSMWEGLFDTRRYVERYAGNLLLPGQSQPATAEALIEQLAVFLNQQVLGPAITEKLGGIHHRALLVQLPETEHDPLAAAFVRVPWEIACPRPGGPPLMRQNLVVRVGLSGMPAASDDEALEDLRVLLVFAEAPGSRPLAMRQEREALLELFHEQVLPERRVEVDVLCHGVTEARLREAVRDRKGYHLIHWSGHGHHNLLELYGEDGKPAHLTGGGLVQLLVDAGGFIPRLVFLSACLSGTFVKVRDWATFEAAMAGRKPEEQTKEAKLPEILAEQPGYTGTALALLRAGVPQVVAMRYEVGDDYACALALGFYKHLLADSNVSLAESALALARSELLQKVDRASGFQAIDHATPLIFGHTQPRFRPTAARSAQLRFVRPQPQPLLAGSLELNPPARFVGRGAELTRLADEWLPRHKPAVALVQGLAGLGKTAIAAEAIHLWHPRFDWVLAFQAKPMALALEEFYSRLDAKLTLESTTYREKCENSRNVRIYLELGKPLSGSTRYERMRNNLMEALRDERILLILDNFETNLESIKCDTGYACEDPEWDRLLVDLAEQLPETGSRVLITSRHRLVALATDKTMWVPLGPLPLGEAGLYIRSHPELRRLYYANEAGRALVVRLLEVSRGHPLILDYLSRLVPDRRALSQALDRLQSKGLQTLPDVFVPIKSNSDREREWTYLKDAMISSVDFLIQRLNTPDVRRLLWIVTLSSEPVREDIVASVWSGGPLWLIANGKLWVVTLPADADQMLEGMSEQLAVMPPDVRRHFAEKLDHISANTPIVGRLLDELRNSGLLKSECGQDEIDETPILAFHELVRERIAAWVEQHPEERVGWTQEQAWVAYGERYTLAYLKWRYTSHDNAMEVVMEAGRRALIYLTRARAFEHLYLFASSVVTSTNNAALLSGVVNQLKLMVNGMPADNIYRCYVRGLVADSLVSTGQYEQAFPFFEQAADEAQTAEQWAETGGICGNWGSALLQVGQLEAAKGVLLRAIQAQRRAGWDHLDLVGIEFEALRVDVRQGKAKRVLPEIEQRLNELRSWWRRYRPVELVAAPDDDSDPIARSRALIVGLGVAYEANMALERWQAGLDTIDEREATERALGEEQHALAITRFNKYSALLRLKRISEAQKVLEDCLQVFRDTGDLAGQASALVALANVWDERHDTDQALALLRQGLSILNHLTKPVERAKAHADLAVLLDKVANHDDPVRHLLASIAYYIACNHHEGLEIPLYAITLSMHGDTQTSKRHKLPRLAELLALPEFAALQEFLTDRQVDLTELQETIDQLVEQGQASMPIRLLNKSHLWVTACLESLRGWTRQIYEKL